MASKRRANLEATHGNPDELLAVWARPPVVVEEVEGGKRACCLRCGEIGPVSEGTEEALRALRDRARQRDEALSA